MIIWHVQCTLRQNLITSKRTVGYFHNTSILNLILTEKQCYLIPPQWSLMKNPIPSYHLSCTMASLSKHFRMWPFLVDILHCYQIHFTLLSEFIVSFSACALRQPKPLEHVSLMQTRIIPPVIFQKIIVCVFKSTTTIIWLGRNLYPFFSEHQQIKISFTRDVLQSSVLSTSMSLTRLFLKCCKSLRINFSVCKQPSSGLLLDLMTPPRLTVQRSLFARKQNVVLNLHIRNEEYAQ